MKNSINIFFIVIAMAYVNAKPIDELSNIYEECIQEVGVPEKLIESNGLPNFDDPQQRCILACMLKKAGRMVDGKILLETVFDHIPKHFPYGPEEAKQFVNHCIETANKGDNECVVASSAMKCIMEKARVPFHPLEIN